MLERPLQDVVRAEEHVQLNFEKEEASRDSGKTLLKFALTTFLNECLY